MSGPRRSKASVLLLAVLSAAHIPAGGQEAPAAAIQRYQAGQYEEAIRILEPFVRHNARSHEGHYYLGSAYLARRNGSDAARHLERAANLDRSNPRYTFSLAQAYMMQVQRANPLSQINTARKIRTALERTAELDPGHMEARYALVRFHLMAPGVVGGGVRAARSFAEELARLDRSWGHEARADIHLEEKNEGEAERELLAAVALRPERMTPYTSLANLYGRRGDHERAMEVFETLYRADPERTLALFHIGRIASTSGVRLDRGEEALRRYLTEAPGNDPAALARANVRLGAIQERKGEPSAAARSYEEALKLQAGSREAREGLQRVREAWNRGGEGF
jgi:tetratricopeptide (TPR) repeat protein